MISAPNYYSPDKNMDKCLERRNLALKTMLEQEKITQAEYMQAVDEKIDLKKTGIKNDENNPTQVEIEVGENETVLNINIWPSFIDDFTVTLVSPNNRRTQEISKDSGLVKNIISNTRINGFFYPIEPYSLNRRISI